MMWCVRIPEKKYAPFSWFHWQFLFPSSLLLLRTLCCSVLSVTGNVTMSTDLFAHSSSASRGSRPRSCLDRAGLRHRRRACVRSVDATRSGDETGRRETADRWTRGCSRARWRRFVPEGRPIQRLTWWNLLQLQINDLGCFPIQAVTRSHGLETIIVISMNMHRHLILSCVWSSILCKNLCKLTRS